MAEVACVQSFLRVASPEAWFEAVPEHIPELLIDHANCEKKAATTAMNLLYKHIDREDLLKKMSQLAREELLHFEQVVNIMKDRGIAYRHVSSSRYAAGLREQVRKGGINELVDVLIVGAFIEARSCERFAKLAPFLDDVLAKFYRSLLRSEGRHYQDYLALAAQYADAPIAERVAEFREFERELIESPDAEFRFHSGVPVAA